MNFTSFCMVIIEALAEGVALIAIWLDQFLGGVFGGTSVFYGVQAQLRQNYQRARRMAQILMWMFVISTITIIIGIRADNSPLLTVTFAVWALFSLAFLHALNAAAQRWSSMQFAVNIVGMYSMFMFWCSFMALTGAPKEVGWVKSFEILLFLLFMSVTGIITGSKVPWARWLMTGSVWFVFVTSVIPFEGIPILKATKRLTVGLLGRSTVETNKVARGVTPSTLEHLEPDTYYVTNRSLKLRLCDDCVQAGKVDPNKVSSSTMKVDAGQWVAQVPETGVVSYQMRSYLLVFSAIENNPDSGFRQDKKVMLMVPPDALELKEVPQAQNQSRDWIAGVPHWMTGVIGWVLLILGGCAFVFWIKSKMKAANNDYSVNRQMTSAHLEGSHDDHAAGHSDHGHGHGHGGGFPIKEFVAGLFAAIIVIILIQIWTNLNEMNHHRLPPQAFMAGTTGASGVSQSSPSAAPAATGVVVMDSRYDLTPVRSFGLLSSNPQSGEYEFLLDARIVNQELPVIPTAGEIWEFGFRDTLVCAWGVSCVGAPGQTQNRKPESYAGDDRARYNLDDFPAQSVNFQGAFLVTGDSTINLGTTKSWVVSDAASGKKVQAGFNVRRSEASQARGGGILKIKITKKV